MNQRRRLNVTRIRRKNRVRGRIYGTAERPRLSIFRSNRYVYAQLINDAKGVTLVSASTYGMKKDAKTKKSDSAKILGKAIAEKATKAGVKSAVFDRGSYQYHGRVKAFVEGVREGGLQI